ncbi:hypothetical protein HQ637_04860 [Enterococcus faecium]|nr:hypothetical protein [Enterococcus faecium]
MCKICDRVEFETSNLDDRDLLLIKPPLVEYGRQSVFINGSELLLVEYNIGYFIIRKRETINFCPLCGRALEQEEA